MTKPSIATDVHQHLDVLGHFTAKITFHLVTVFNHLAELDDLALAQTNARAGAGAG